MARTPLWSCQATALPSHLQTGDAWTSQVWQCLGHHASPRFAWRGLQPLVGPPAQHPRAESPLGHPLISAFLPSSAWIRGIDQIPNAVEPWQVFLLYLLHAQPGYVALVGYPNAAELVCIRCDTYPPCPLLRVLISYTAPCLWLVSQAHGLYSLLVLPGHSTALTPADGGFMDFLSVAVPWSPCFSSFARWGLQHLVGPPAPHPGDETLLSTTSRSLLSVYLPISAWICGIGQ